MKLLLLFTLVALGYSSHIGYSDEDEVQWELFKIGYAREYGDKEDKTRKEIFMNNLNFIRCHNKKFEQGEVTFTVGVNQFADWTSDEIHKLGGFRPPNIYYPRRRATEEFEIDENLEVPKTVDWRKKGAVTPVKDQGKCGSSYAFSATGSLEGQNYIKTEKLVSLSEQQLVDCSIFSEGCDGGVINGTFEYIKSAMGIEYESSYPYEAQKGTCRRKLSEKVVDFIKYVDVTKGSEKALQQAVAKIGPISALIDRRHQAFLLYKSGVYMEPACSSQDLDHYVLVIGYGTTRNGEDFWLVKNSWGTSWGMRGYIMMARNHDNMCGIATQASYPTV
ncbi:procathepsin L-like [Macrosteles quadrilineatus]|uniref:procathepsin L-like n=1 Tax=Macrosteles quadrilineatus TaxID=74068 RepID=UPI0023E26371|nr:procathepsin L-like [Macrosteles quadrilineatus]